MKNVIIYNKVTTDKFGGKRSDGVIENYLKAQIDNSLNFGWNRNDIIIATNFDFEHNGVKNVILKNVCEWSGYNNKWYGIKELYETGLIKDECWLHDYDNWQISDLKFPNFDGKIAGATYVYTPEWNTASMFFKKDCIDILNIIHSFLEYYKHVKFDSDENAISALRRVNQFKEYFSTINNQFNVGLTRLMDRYNAANKPIISLGVKLLNKKEFDLFESRHNNLNLIPTDLYKIINQYS